MNADEFIGVKSYEAKGKRLTTWQIDNIQELEPEPEDDPEIGDDPDNSEGDTADDDGRAIIPDEELASTTDLDKSDDEVRDELLGQSNFDF